MAVGPSEGFDDDSDPDRGGGTSRGTRPEAIGPKVDLAPDLDGRSVWPDVANPGELKSFGPSTAKVTGEVGAFAQGFRRAHVPAVVKNFPGLGHATGNTDIGSVARSATTRPGVHSPRDCGWVGDHHVVECFGVRLDHVSGEPVIAGRRRRTSPARFSGSIYGPRDGRGGHRGAPLECRARIGSGTAVGVARVLGLHAASAGAAL